MATLVKLIREIWPDFQAHTIFDVGASNGQLTQTFLHAFPSAKVFSFEPGPIAFAKLEKRFPKEDRVNLRQIALDKSDGNVRFTKNLGMGNHIIRDKSKRNDFIEVNSMRGDTFCIENKIEHIDILKIDTEGNDLNCLVGFSEMIRNQEIKFIEVECTTNLDNRFHVHMERFIHFLHPFNYRLSSAYDFYRIVFKTNQKLNGAWFCNALFALEVENPVLRRDGQN